MQAIWKPAAAGNFATGRRLPISQITFHHIAGDAPGALARFQKPGTKVSATYVIASNGTLYQCVKEGDTPYTDANSDSNARSITIEHAGGIENVPYTEAMYRTSVELVRDLIYRYGIESFKRHREVSDAPTLCPGTLDVERILIEALGGDMAEPADYRVNKGDVQNVKGWLGLPLNEGDYGFVGYSWKEFVTAILTGDEWKNHKKSLEAGTAGATTLGPGIYKVK